MILFQLKAKMSLLAMGFGVTGVSTSFTITTITTTCAVITITPEGTAMAMTSF